MSILTDEDKRNERWHYQFVHNVAGDFIKNTLDYFVDYLYPRFSNISSVVGTYSKAIVYLNQQQEEGRELDNPILPALILNPSGEFSMADANAGGRQLWRYPNLLPGFVSKIFEPIYKDNNVMVNVGFSRVKGELDLIVLLNSFYELFDVKMLFLQIFGGGGDRPITPVIFDSFLILPSEVYRYTYSNDVEGTSYTLNWLDCDTESRVIETTNQTEVVYPCKIRPQFKMTNMSDGSERYGGDEKLAEWRLAITLEYEVEIPTFITLRSDYAAERMVLNLRYGSVYSTYDGYNSEIPVNQEKITYEWETGLNENSNSEADLPETSNIVSRRDLIFKNRYFHIVTENDAEILSDATNTLDIAIPVDINDPNQIIINSKDGKLEHGTYYDIINNNILRIYSEYVPLEEGDIIELFIYDYQPIQSRFDSVCNVTSKVVSELEVV